MRSLQGALALSLLVWLVAGCAPVQPTGTSTDERLDIGTGPHEDDDLLADREARPDRDVRIDGGQLLLVTPTGERALHELDPANGEPVHAALRPGGHAEDTVLLLTRVDDVESARYELRYLVAAEDGVTDLYWFPWRLQVDDAVVSVLDTPPVPVWAPDGTELAWIEWTEQGTRLRTVGWIDDGTVRNPSDESATYVLEEVPAGVQLEAWEQDSDGDPVLVGRLDGQPYRIEVLG